MVESRTAWLNRLENLMERIGLGHERPWADSREDFRHDGFGKRPPGDRLALELHSVSIDPAEHPHCGEYGAPAAHRQVNAAE